MSDAFEQATVGEIVASDVRAAGVFEQFGIDFCCGGRRSLAEACAGVAVDPATVVRALQALPPPGTCDDTDVTRWPADRLIDEIVTRHHGYVRTELPAIQHHLAKLVEVHGVRHPELARIAVVFERMGRGLLQHMMKEEQVLFPYVRELEAAPAGRAPASPFGTVENPIRMMEREHLDAGNEMQLIRELASGFVVPEDGCATYRVTLEQLAAFERDLHRHVHLENTVLFPKAIEIERRSWSG